MENEKTGGVTVSEINVADTPKKAEKKKSEDKLVSLKAEYERRLAVYNTAEEKLKAVEAKVAAEEKKRHDRDVERFEGVCEKCAASYDDVIELLNTVYAAELTVKDVIELIGANK